MPGLQPVRPARFEPGDPADRPLLPVVEPAVCHLPETGLHQPWRQPVRTLGREERSRVPPYRRIREHGARCNECEGKTPFPIGAFLGQSAVPEKEEKVVLLDERRRFRGLREAWQAVIDGARTNRSVTDTIEISGIGTGNYYRYLERIGARLRDYHS